MTKEVICEASDSSLREKVLRDRCDGGPKMNPVIPVKAGNGREPVTTIAGKNPETSI